jgi:exonuclease III
MKIKKMQKLKMSMFAVSLLLIFSHTNKHVEFGKKYPGESIQIKVGAYNVEFSDKGTATEIGEALKPYNFDVVCFSEAPGGGWTKEVGAIMDLNHVVVGKYSTAGHKDKYKTVASRTPLNNYEEVLMADTLHTATRASTIIGGKEITFYAVHFPFGWRDQAHIDETTGKITAFVDYLKERQSDEISIAMGDFNFVLSSNDYRSPYYELFIDIGLDASWRDLDIDVTPLGTMVKFKPGQRKAGGVIDHILYNTKKVKALDGQIIEMEVPLSDHKPVWATLQIK